ncbi:MAG TPA: SDR family NAD(P)-dependent oxidoreductase [Allosphingosinicella sp.]|nr:SDR family NAD(P)-dependent oxidoreductase [Allosphingosinicella sp.]
MPAERSRIVIAGMACRYPDAADPAALFRNTLEGRLSFRPIPPERLALDDYAAAMIGEADSITRIPAGLLTGWRFDPVRFRIPRAAFEATDLAHWLALEVAADAIEATGGAASLDRERTAVIVANTLTGEFSRAALLRLRWPWLDRELDEALAAAGIGAAEAAAARSGFRDRLRAAFRAPDEESLAGGLANTIAGRIANQFDLHGGAWSVDAACASSLVAVASAGDLIASGRADAVVVAAVDLSLDPFELVGFSRNGALARGRMRVFDARAEGFWPGEGAGAIVLVAAAVARRLGLAPALALAGWGVATDGSGGLTRPDVDGQRRALERAYARAAIDPAALGYVEAHGTGTAIGDPTEIAALAALRGEARGDALPIASIKGNIGHTKAAAGLAGLIRTAVAMDEGIVPPHSGCEQPHPAFAETGHRVRATAAPEEWRSGDRRVAGISSFGFGGVNAHVVLAGPDRPRRRALPPAPPVRDAELFLFRGPDAAGVREAVSALAARAPALSFAELGDAAADAARQLGTGPVSLAFQASSPDQLGRRLTAARGAIDGGVHPDIWLGQAGRPPRIGFVFPGQAAPVRPGGGAWARRFPGRYLPFAIAGDPAHTAAAQPAIAGACLAGLDLLDRLGIAADAVVGHSLGEFAALAWAGSIARADLVPLTAARGQAMGALEPGAMVQLGCGRDQAQALARGLDVAIACLNAEAETIVSGAFAAIEAIEHRAEDAGIGYARLSVSHAFHSAMMAPAAAALAEALDRLALAPPRRPIVSTVTGDWIRADADLRAMLIGQLTSPVQFIAAAAKLSDEVDVMVEVGPGAGLTRLLAAAGHRALSLDVFAEQMSAALDVVATLFALGAEINPAPLFEGPGIRPLAPAPPVLLASPCGGSGRAAAPIAAISPEPERSGPRPITDEGGSPLARLIGLVAEETGLDPVAISPEDRFLDDLHLNSLAVSRLVARLGTALNQRPSGFRTAFASARLREVAEAFAEGEALPVPAGGERVQGVARWVRCFSPVLEPLPERLAASIRWHRTALPRPSLEAADGLLIDLDRPWNCARDARPLLALCQQAVDRYAHLAICHDGAPLGGYARSFADESLFESVRLIAGDADPALLSRQVFGFEEVVRDADGRPASSALTLRSDAPNPAEPPAGAILVTGGARGIGAECAIRIAERCKRPLILVGRAAPCNHEVTATLARLADLDADARYVRCDVADAVGLDAAVAAAAAELGPITFLIHAAGANEPAPFREIDAELLARTLAAKTTGLAASIEACGPSLARVVAFGSIIGRLGLAGEAHYALANAEQTRLLAEIAASRPGLSGLAIEWSVWGSAGMGERLGVIDRLSAEGVDAISLDDAIDAFEALALSGSQGAVVVTSRFGQQAPIGAETPLRFLDRPLVHTPGVELVIEARVGLGRDPYLDDHKLGGGALMPAVMLIEAMAQACQALHPGPIAGLQDLKFDTAVHAGEGDLPIRIGALRDADGKIAAEVRTAQDGFLAPCLGGRFRVGARGPGTVLEATAEAEIDAAPLYGPLFFQGSRFRRLAWLGGVSSRSVGAVFAPAPDRDWFGAFEPQALLLGDPGVRDAALHALQCCVPHRQLIPISAAAIDFFAGGAPVRLDAAERWSRGDDYGFDIVLADAEGRIVEHWREAVFRAVGTIDIAPVLASAPGLARAWLERRAREAIGDDSLALALVDDPSASRAERRRRAAATLGFAAPARRGDGRPIAAGRGGDISFAHAEGVTIAVSAARRVGCDIERVAAFAAEELALAWTAEEALRKVGSRAPLSGGGDRLYTGDANERIAAFGPFPTEGAGRVAVAVGMATP